MSILVFKNLSNFLTPICLENLQKLPQNGVWVQLSAYRFTDKTFRDVIREFVAVLKSMSFSKLKFL